MQKKIVMMIGSMLIIFLLGACRQGNEVASIDVPMFEFSKEYLDWMVEQEFEISLNFEDLDGNTLEEEAILTGNWEMVNVFPLQLSIEDATLLITSTKDVVPLAVNFQYKFMEANEERTEFLEKFNRVLEVDFSEFVSIPEGNSVDLLIWADIELVDFAFVESEIEGEQPIIERTFFKSSLQEEEGVLIYNWLDMSGAYLRNGVVFTDNQGLQRFFAFGLDNSQETEEMLIFMEIKLEDKIEIPEVEQPPIDEVVVVPDTSSTITTSLPTTHTVQAGETLFSISQRFGVSVAQIQQANYMGASTDISVGQQLNINDDLVIAPILPQVEAPSVAPTPEPTPPPASPQPVVSVAFRANAGANFSRVHTFHGSAFGIEGSETDIFIWSNVILRDFQVHLGEESYRMGDIAVGEAVNVQTLLNYFAAINSTSISFVNEGGAREFFSVTDMFGPGADQAGLIPPLG